MFLQVYEYDFAERLEAHWRTIRAEFESIPPARWLQWPEREIYDFGWRALPLIVAQQTIDENAQLCPGTTALLRSIPTLVNAGFSLFQAGTHVHPHVGYTDSVYRFHLGIQIPVGCGLRVRDEVRVWQEGKLLAFDDMVEHSAWNNSHENRAILLFDVLRPGARLETTASSRKATEDYLEMLRTTTAGGVH